MAIKIEMHNINILLLILYELKKTNISAKKAPIRLALVPEIKIPYINNSVKINKNKFIILFGALLLLVAANKMQLPMDVK